MLRSKIIPQKMPIQTNLSNFKAAFYYIKYLSPFKIMNMHKKVYFPKNLFKLCKKCTQLSQKYAHLTWPTLHCGLPESCCDSWLDSCQICEVHVGLLCCEIFGMEVKVIRNTLLLALKCKNFLADNLFNMVVCKHTRMFVCMYICGWVGWFLAKECKTFQNAFKQIFIYI